MPQDAAPPSVASPGPQVAPRASRLSRQISIVYAAIYAHYGAFGLFIPLWFAHRGITPEQIGTLMALPLFLRLLFVGPVSGLADRLRRIREVLLACVVGAMLLMSGLSFAHSYLLLLIFFTVFALVWDPLPVLADAYAVVAVRAQGADYGRMRLWGSSSFAVMNIVSGSLISLYSVEVVPWLTAALLALPIVPILLLPPDRGLSVREDVARRRQDGGAWVRVVANLSVVGAIVATSLIGASHALLNTFGVIQFTGMGVSGATIGVLVAISIVAEIVVLFVAQRALGKHSPLWLIVISGAVAVARWVGMALQPALPIVVLLQLLNGMSGMGTITGLMLFIAQRVEARFMSTTQGVYAVILGALTGFATFASGYAWHALGPNAYLFAALMAAGGAGIAVVLLFQRNGDLGSETPAVQRKLA